jgi:hypothetical protein
MTLLANEAITHIRRDIFENLKLIGVACYNPFAPIDSN